MHLLIFPFLLMASSCLGCSSTTAVDDKKKWTSPAINGHWKLMDTEIVQEVHFLGLHASEPDPLTIVVHEDSPWDSYRKFDLVFENDSMYKIDYPIEAHAAEYFFLDTGYIHLVNGKNTRAYPVELVNDTLYLYRSLGSDPGFFKETYVQTGFNDSVLSVMKKYGVNYPALAGTWYLIRVLDYDYGTHYELQFPYQLPDSITFSRQQMIDALENEKRVMITTDGIKRSYSFYYYLGNIFVEPGEWCKEEDSWIMFNPSY